MGLHLVVGPNRHVYLERASQPVVAQSFVDHLGAALERDDDLFNVALVSFGSFGIIHGVMLENRDLFLLHAVRFQHPFDARIENLIETLDLQALALPADAVGVPRDEPYHFELVFNPNTGSPPEDVVVLAMYEDAFPAHYQPPPWDDPDSGPGASGLEILGSLLDRLPQPLGHAIVPILNEQVEDKYEPYYKRGVIRDLFRGESTQGKTLAVGIGLPQNRAREALGRAFGEFETLDAVLPILVSMRFVKKTSALLGHAHFDPAAVLEIDSINTPKARAYVRAVWSSLAAAAIPFTLHWGKFNDYLTAARVRAAFDGAVDTWLGARRRLMPEASVRRVFDNRFIEKLGLSG